MENISKCQCQTNSNIHQQKMSFIWNDFMLIRKNIQFVSPDLNIRLWDIVVLFLQHMEFFSFYFILFS